MLISARKNKSDDSSKRSQSEVAPSTPPPKTVASQQMDNRDNNRPDSSLSPPPSDLSGEPSPVRDSTRKSASKARSASRPKSLVPSIQPQRDGKRKFDSEAEEGEPEQKSVKRPRGRPPTDPGLETPRKSSGTFGTPSPKNTKRDKSSIVPPSRSTPRRRAAQSQADQASAKQKEGHGDDDEEDPFPPRMLGEYPCLCYIVSQSRMLTAVWAKCKPDPCNFVLMHKLISVLSFPHFPAEIVDPSDPENIIPEPVLDNRETIERDNHAQGQKTWLVRFFDAQDSYGWIPASRLDYLGYDDGKSPCESSNGLLNSLTVATDEMYLQGKDRSNKSKGFRLARHRLECRRAYR